MAKLFANSGDPDAASYLGLHCLPVTLLQVTRLQLVKVTLFIIHLGFGKSPENMEALSRHD